VEGGKRDSRRLAHVEDNESLISDPDDVATVATSDHVDPTSLQQDYSIASPGFRAPEAAMVPNTIGITASPESNARTPLVSSNDGARQNLPHTTRVQQSRLCNATRANLTTSDNPSTESRDGVRVDVLGDVPPSRKRPFSATDQDDGTRFSSLHKNGKLKTSRGLKHKGSSSGLSHSSPPGLRPTDQGEGDLNPHAGSTAGPREGRTRPESQAKTVSINETGRGDADSVQGDTIEHDVVEDTITATALQGTHPSLIVRLKLNHTQVSQLRRDRKRLALALLTSLKGDPEASSSFAKTLALIKDLWKADVVRLRETLGDAFTPYKQVLGHWQDLMGILLNFRDATGFRGDQRAWKTHFAGLQGASRPDARRHLLEAGIATDDWILERQRHEDFTISGFSVDVADVLFAMADWADSMDDEDKRTFEEQITQLNESLFGWFN